MADGKKTVVVYTNWITTFEKLSDEEAGILIKHLFRYINDMNPVAPNRLIELVFEPFKHEIDESIKRSRIGKFHWNWKGGKSPLNHKLRTSSEMNNWRLKVYERDKYICQLCGQKGGILNAHHIKPFSVYPELMFDVSNGLTLCRDCHIKLHKKEREWEKKGG